MRLLIDTHVFLWMATEPERLRDARSAVENPANTVLLSAVSTWELAVKSSIGRIALPEPVGAYVASRIRAMALDALPIDHRHAAAVEDLPLHHRDPFDRLLVVQAGLTNATLVTADTAMEPYDVDILWAR